MLMEGEEGASKGGEAKLYTEWKGNGGTGQERGEREKEVGE